MTFPTLTPGRAIEGISAVLLPYGSDERPDWTTFRQLLDRTWSAGLTPAVNMDTGYVNLLTDDERARMLAETQDVADGRRFVAGAFIEGRAGDPVALYRTEIDAIRRAGGTPIVFQSTALTSRDDDGIVALYREVARDGGPLLAFELGQMFAPFGRIYSDDLFARLLDIEGIVGAKHSSLDRTVEWRRLSLRDRARPDFAIYTGNDLAIDMVFYGSDYLLGLSAFHVEAFALRDRLWREEDPRAFMINDLLQYLGHFTFRPPVPTYKHSAAQFLKIRGLVGTNLAHPHSAVRPGTDMVVLEDIARRIDAAIARMSA